MSAPGAAPRPTRGCGLAVLAAAGVAWPRAAAACSWCVASAFGDRSFNWPYLSLIVVPFVVGAAIAVTLARSAGVDARALLGRPGVARPASGASESIKETT